MGIFVLFVMVSFWYLEAVVLFSFPINLVELCLLVLALAGVFNVKYIHFREIV